MIRSRFILALIAAAFSAPAFAQTTLPSGTTATLPPGHPSFEQMTAAAASTQTAATGSLTITLVAGTAGATIGANESLAVELYHRNAPLKKYDLKTNAQGTAQIPDLPIMPPVVALISVNHAGLLQQIVTPELSTAAPTQALQMKVYETTDAAPAWNVAMQHMIIQWDAEKNAIHVIEMISTSTAGDRAWLGANTPAGRVTMIVPLPPGAQQVELGDGFTEQASRIADGNLVTGDALFPGRAEFRLSYMLPITNGAAKLPIAAPAAADNLIIFAPADGATIQATGITGGDVVDTGNGKVRMYRAQNVTPGAPISLAVSDFAASASAGELPAATAAPASSTSARNVAVGGAFLLVLVGGAMMLIKKPQPRKA